MGSWEWDRDADEYVWDEGQFRIFGVDRSTFQPTLQNVRNCIHPDDWIKMQVGVERLIAQGENLHHEFRVVRPEGEIRWCVGVAAAGMPGSDGGRKISGVTIDITDRKAAEEQQQLLAREVDHRAKNALALVQSIVRLTKADNPTAYVSAIEGRIRALSTAHNVLAQSRWQGADLGGLVAEELAPFLTGDSRRTAIGGPELTLQPVAAQTLALALHELTTNAAKYGALSSIDGRLNVTWALDEGRLILRWSESGGPKVKAPKSQGFGSRIIKASIERQLGGTVSFDWKPEGLQCEIVVPCGDRMVVANLLETGPRRADLSACEGRMALDGNRILIVEDESLVALSLTETLTQLGFDVIGPYGTVADASEAVSSQQIDAAILDVNLNGEMVYPLADNLLARGLPFVFVTGYGPESIDKRFGQIPVVQKPVDRDSLNRLFAIDAGKPKKPRRAAAI